MRTGVWLLGALLGCGNDGANDGYSKDRYTISLTKPELARPCNGEVCPVPTGGIPPRCPDGTYCNRRTIRYVSSPPGIDCGTADDQTECSHEFAAGTSLLFEITLIDTSGSCPFYSCAIEPLAMDCKMPFIVDNDYVLTFSFQCYAP